MPYTTIDSLTARFGSTFLIRLTDDSQAAIDTDKVNRAIAATDGIIDSFLRQIYTLPLAQVPDELEGAAVDLVMEKIYACKPERETPKDVKDRAKAAMDFLRDIKKGLATLSVATLPPAPGTNGPNAGGGFISTNKKKSDRIFSDRKLDSFTYEGFSTDRRDR